jgi:hypothetical protein
MLFKHKAEESRGVMDTIKVEDNYQPFTFGTSFEKHALVAWVCCTPGPMVATNWSITYSR